MTAAIKQPGARNLRRFKPHPAYKDSGVEWLGEIPAHWEVKRLKHLLAATKGAIKTGPFGSQLQSSEMQTGDIKIYNQRSVLDRDFSGGDNYVSLEKFAELRAFETFPGDLLITTRGSIGHCAVLPEDAERGILHPCLMRVQPDRRRILTRFLEIQIEEAAIVLDQLRFMSNATTIDVIYSESLREVWLTIPPLEEQATVAAFLDHETARIDALVAKKERLIELLQEKRTALITRAVTKGLNPNVPMKDSGVEWLGEIPAHWTAKHLRWAIMFQRGHDLPTDEREDGQVPVVTSSGISSTHSQAVAKAPGIVTGRYGTIGHFHLIQQDYWPLNTTLYSIDLRGNDPRFLRYMLTHLSPLFLLNAVKSAVPGVDRNDIHPTRTVVPPLREQLAIADFLDAKSAEIDALIAKVRNAIDRLKELRTALISAAVTGKIDVREEVA